MIISNSKRFIFLHLRKAAGSSLTVYLSSFANKSNDYVVGAFLERLRSRRLPLSDILSSLTPPYHLSTLRYLQQSRNILGFLNVNYKTKFYNTLGANPEHSSLDHILPLLDFPLSEYDIIVCIRDPLRRVISDYNYLSKSLVLCTPNNFNGLNFKDFFAMYINPAAISPFIPSNRRLEDLLGGFASTIAAYKLHILPFDNLQNSLVCLCKTLFGVQSFSPLQFHKKFPAQLNVASDLQGLNPCLIEAARDYFSLEYQLLQNN